MKLKCPACGTAISATDINVQNMVAVCPHCNNVFKFEGDFKAQGRKIKAPNQFTVGSDDPARLNIAFRWNWRTEPPLALAAVVFAFVVLTGLLFSMILSGAHLSALLLLLAPELFLSYVLLTLFANRTHYESDGETLTVHTEPLYYWRYGKKVVPINEIQGLSVERPDYAPFPEGKAGFYNVYVHTLDGDKIMIAAYVNFEHAHFIEQEINAHLQAVKEIPHVTMDESVQGEDARVLPPENVTEKQLETHR